VKKIRDGRAETEGTDRSEMPLHTQDLFETAVQECIASKELQKIYLKFAVKEFTTGAKITLYVSF
jgi:hypothetical protein